MNKKHIRFIIDIAMTVLLPLLMAYSLIGETFHEVVGTVIFVMFIFHHVLNRKWYGVLFKGKYNAARIFRTVVNMLLLVFMILQPVSGILMSKHLYTFLPVLTISSQARSIHMLSAYWGYVLMCVHAGTHLVTPLRRLYLKNKIIFVTICMIFACVAAYGCAAYIKRGFPGYMSGRTMFAFFDYSEPRVFFFLDYIAIMVLFIMIGCIIIYAVGKLNLNNPVVRKQNREQ